MKCPKEIRNTNKITPWKQTYITISRRVADRGVDPRTAYAAHPQTSAHHPPGFPYYYWRQALRVAFLATGESARESLDSARRDRSFPVAEGGRAYLEYSGVMQVYVDQLSAGCLFAGFVGTAWMGFAALPALPQV